jgi:hypothetical protein
MKKFQFSAANYILGKVRSKIQHGAYTFGILANTSRVPSFEACRLAFYQVVLFTSSNAENKA